MGLGWQAQTAPQWSRAEWPWRRAGAFCSPEESRSLWLDDAARTHSQSPAGPGQGRGQGWMGPSRAAAPSRNPTAGRGQLCLLNHVPPAGEAGVSRTGRAGALGAPLPQPRHGGSLPWDKEGRSGCVPHLGKVQLPCPSRRASRAVPQVQLLAQRRQDSCKIQTAFSFFPSWHLFFLCTSLHTSGVNPASHLLSGPDGAPWLPALAPLPMPVPALWSRAAGCILLIPNL